jgi:hypothetical protein
MIHLRRFNKDGIERLRATLQTLRQGETADIERLLWDEELTAQISDNPVMKTRQFKNRFEVGEFIFDVLQNLDEPIEAVDQDIGLWAWLAAFFHAEIKRTTKHAKDFPGADARWIPEIDDFQKYYRHLLAGPYQIFRAHRDNPRRAMAVLANPIGAPGDAAEQLIARQEILTNPNFMEAATRLYYDEDNNRLKSGAGSHGPGTPRRLAKDMLDQFDLTWDLYGMSSDQILALLPEEFNRFRPDLGNGETG